MCKLPLAYSKQNLPEHTSANPQKCIIFALFLTLICPFILSLPHGDSGKSVRWRGDLVLILVPRWDSFACRFVMWNSPQELWGCFSVLKLLQPLSTLFPPCWFPPLNCFLLYACVCMKHSDTLSKFKTPPPPPWLTPSPAHFGGESQHIKAFAMKN